MHKAFLPCFSLLDKVIQTRISSPRTSDLPGVVWLSHWMCDSMCFYSTLIPFIEIAVTLCRIALS